MKKHFVFSFLVLIFILPISVCAMDELEKAYKEQLERYNSEIRSSESLLKVQRDGAVRYLELKNQALKRGGTQQANIATSEYSKAERREEELQSKINDLKNKRQELKINLLEKYQTLPVWWTEEPGQLESLAETNKKEGGVFLDENKQYEDWAGIGVDGSNGPVKVITVNNAGMASSLILPGDIILGINRKAVRNVTEYIAAIEKLKSSSVLFLISRGGSSFYVRLP